MPLEDVDIDKIQVSEVFASGKIGEMGRKRISSISLARKIINNLIRASKSMDWFLYYRELRHEGVKSLSTKLP